MLKLKQILCSILVLGSLLSSPSLWAQKETKVNIAARQISLKNLIQAVENRQIILLCSIILSLCHVLFP